jgi:hypothetical protein
LRIGGGKQGRQQAVHGVGEFVAVLVAGRLLDDLGERRQLRGVDAGERLMELGRFAGWAHGVLVEQLTDSEVPAGAERGYGLPWIKSGAQKVGEASVDEGEGVLGDEFAADQDVQHPDVPCQVVVGADESLARSWTPSPECRPATAPGRHLV